MKFTAHYPVEQYGFMEAEFETDDLKIAVHNYNQLAEVFKPKPLNELPTKEWNIVLNDLMLEQKAPSEETFNRFSPYQRDCYHDIEKTFSRLEYKNK